MDRTEAGIVWLWLPAHFTLAWLVAGLDLFVGAPR